LASTIGSNDPCPLCQGALINVGHPSGGLFQLSCRNCGRFDLELRALAVIRSRMSENPRIGSILSHAVFLMQRAFGTPFIDLEKLEYLQRNTRLPDPGEQCDNLILWLGDAFPSPGCAADLAYSDLRATIGAIDVEGVRFVVGSSARLGLLTAESHKQGAKLMLSLEGWQRYAMLARGRVESRSVFVAMPFGDSALDRIYVDFVKPAVAETGFEARRLDESPEAGLIDDRLRVQIRRARLLVSELTGNNDGVYWESGFAEGLGKPVIYTCERSFFQEQRTHFDTNHLHTVLWEHERLADFAVRLKATIRATLPAEARLED
jgi:hypothetical protein